MTTPSTSSDIASASRGDETSWPWRAHLATAGLLAACGGSSSSSSALQRRQPADNGVGRLDDDLGLGHRHLRYELPSQWLSYDSTARAGT